MNYNISFYFSDTMDRKVDDMFDVISFVLFCRHSNFEEICKSTILFILCSV